MVNHKDIESAMFKVIEVAYSQGKERYDKLGGRYAEYLKTLQRRRDAEDYVRSVAKRLAPNEDVYNKRMEDYKDWYNEEVYKSLEKLYGLYLELANQKEKVEKRSKEDVREILRKIHGLEI
jgi:hypothetical protein